MTGSLLGICKRQTWGDCYAPGHHGKPSAPSYHIVGIATGLQGSSIVVTITDTTSSVKPPPPVPAPLPPSSDEVTIIVHVMLMQEETAKASDWLPRDVIGGCWDSEGFTGELHFFSSFLSPTDQQTLF